MSALAFSPDGASMATGHDMGNVYLFDAHNGSVTATLQQNPVVPGWSTAFHPTIRQVQFSHDGAHVATGTGGGEVKLWDAVGGRLIDTPER